MKNPESAKERNLIKAALRRVFSRSELRRSIIAGNMVEFHTDINRPRVTKWSFCEQCGLIEPSYLMQVDHIDSVVPLRKSLEDMSWDELVDRLWCDYSNLAVLCKPCHKEKSKIENKERRRIKNEKK